MLVLSPLMTFVSGAVGAMFDPVLLLPLALLGWFVRPWWGVGLAALLGGLALALLAGALDNMGGAGFSLAAFPRELIACAMVASLVRAIRGAMRPRRAQSPRRPMA